MVQSWRKGHAVVTSCVTAESCERRISDKTGRPGDSIADTNKRRHLWTVRAACFGELRTESSQPVSAFRVLVSRPFAILYWLESKGF